MDSNMFDFDMNFADQQIHVEHILSTKLHVFNPLYNCQYLFEAIDDTFRYMLFEYHYIFVYLMELDILNTLIPIFVLIPKHHKWIELLKFLEVKDHVNCQPENNSIFHI
jgi:hypothetical protein